MTSRSRSSRKAVVQPEPGVKEMSSLKLAAGKRKALHCPLHRYPGGGLGWGLLLVAPECEIQNRQCKMENGLNSFCIRTHLVRAPSLALPRSTGGGDRRSRRGAN